MKDNEIVTYAAIGLGALLLYEYVLKPKPAIATSTVVPAGQTAMVTQSALPLASNTNLSSLTSSIAKLIAPAKPAAAAAALSPVQTAQATATYNDVDQELAAEYFQPSDINIAPANNYFSPGPSIDPASSLSLTSPIQNNYSYSPAPVISPTLFTDNSDFDFLSEDS